MTILAVLVYNVITILSYKDLLRRFGFLKATRRDFYECGFKPMSQRPIKVSLQFLLISVFFLLCWKSLQECIFQKRSSKS